MPEFHEYRDYLYDDFEFRQDSDTGLGVVTGHHRQVWRRGYVPLGHGGSEGRRLWEAGRR